MLLGIHKPSSIKPQDSNQWKTHPPCHSETRDNIARDTWSVLPFANANWWSTYRVRAVTSASDIDPQVQEALDLPVLDLAAAQDEVCQITSV